MRKLGGVHATHCKNTAGCAPEIIPVPPEVVLPMSMHIGAPSKPVVKPGDEVKVGQLVAEASGFVSSPVYASVSGKVRSIDAFEGAAGAGRRQLSSPPTASRHFTTGSRRPL